jgi:hypothetical protein
LSYSGSKYRRRKENFMDRKPTGVLGIYPTCSDVENAVEAFRDAGFQSADISLLLPEKMSAEYLFAAEATNTSEEATPSAAQVAAIDGPLGWLEEVGPVAIPGEGAFLAAGPIAQALESVALESPTGKLTAALVGMGIPESEGSEYAAMILQGGALLSVHCDSAEWAERGRQLHRDLGGMNIFSTGRSEADSREIRRSMSQWAGR